MLGYHLFSSFHWVWNPSLWNGAGHSQDGSFLLSSNFSETVSETHPEVCFQRDAKSITLTIKINNHIYQELEGRSNQFPQT